MRLIGRVADGATETSARLILLKGEERAVVSEELVLVKNGGEDRPVNQILGVLREGLGKNEFLSYTSYRPDVAYMRHGGEPSGAREVYSFVIKPIGVVGEEGMEPNRAIIQPRSPVYMVEEEDRPLELMARGSDVVWMDAYLEGHEKWRVPVNRALIPYHVAVYGSTGSGKSWFARHVLIPLYRKAGYKTLVLDWSGTDYVSFFEGSHDADVVKISDIALDEESVLSYFEEKTYGFAKNDTVRAAFDEFVEGWVGKAREAVRNPVKGMTPAEMLHQQLKERVDSIISAMPRADWRSSAEKAAKRVFRRLRPQDLRPVMGTTTIEELVEKLDDRQTLVIDMGGALAEGKLGFFISLSRHLYDLMEAGISLNMAMIIDEAPQYAPWEPRGIQIETTEMLKNLAALGRKRMLNLTLIAQGIKGEIGINAAVRRNINTNFFGRIHPLDASGEGGAAEWLSPYGIRPDQLLLLKPGRFYFSGAMNLSPIPLLITYSPEEVQGFGPGAHRVG